ncbi:GNAT family N-acetyltransferase [Oryzifoliimicrobium ureilyticus]|uniref:GNAT family N-acetyltransferase n=1 Tax=Oryzifoliimicrobium ureilyticus TaxID=3113724 RepID=UPI003075EE9F
MRETTQNDISFLIRREDPAQDDIRRLLKNGEDESDRLYPAESNHHLPLDLLRKPEVWFLVARTSEGLAVATGAFVVKGDWAEIKRMWVEEDWRGQGLARRMLGQLIEEARAQGVHRLRLETGIESHAAIALYEKAGFVKIEPFADYEPDPLSVFMELALIPNAQA